ncbi:TPA: hypothetical protein HA336_05935 [Methanopyrus kandleri]|uniref:Uncharacterized protein specific for M.kandleri, MK-40 family n=3 Tax=Methanopyrus kandleri TaxID=2320 RepID=Q8TZ35_METKA|nr:hypothetical protein [Methanopyrus kandleri]AAM01321.1 Uncharacterized protein specific for M.kandleri, MK-40 family [Methanopyrus kandleri AV19]HII70756.1 hypothetical protein [Methanopyrus kandleri]
MVVLAFVLILLALTPLQPVQGQEVGTLAEHLRKAYGEDWPHYAPWVHSEIKVADDVKAYNLRAVDLGYDLVPGVPAHGVLVAYASSSKVGLAFVNRTGEFFKLCEVPLEAPPKYREGLDLDYMEAEGDSTKKTVLIAWGADNRLYALRVKLGVYRPHENANFPAVAEVSNPIEIDLPPGYTDVKRVRVLALGDKFVVFFTARREDKPTEEYGYDLFYALIDPDGTVKLGPKDFGFQDIMVFQVKPLNGPSLIGLAFMGRWRQYIAGVWWVTMRLEGNSIKVIQTTLISDSDFEIPCVERALLDFSFYPINSDEYSVLVVWNDCRCPKVLFERIAQLVPGAEFRYRKDKTWVVYGQRLKVDKNGYTSKLGKNFPVMYLMTVTQTTTQTISGGAVESWDITFGEIDSVTVYTTHGSEEKYFVVDASIKVFDVAISKWLNYARTGEFEEKNTYGFDILSVPLPVNPDSPGIVGTEVDMADVEVSLTNFGTSQTKQKWVAYPVFNKGGCEIIPKDQPSPECFIYLYGTIQFNETHATETPIVAADQTDVKARLLPDGVIIEGFIENINKKPSLFVMPVVAVVGPVKDIYLEYDTPDELLHKYIYPLDPFTVLKFRPIRTEDHPGAQVGPVTYDLRSQQPALPTVYLEVSYTTDFSDRVPAGPALVEILGPAPPEEPTPGTPLSGYAIIGDPEVMRSENVEIERIVNEELAETQVHVKFLPPAVETLERIAQVVASGTIDREAVREAASDALDELSKYLKQYNLLQSPSGIPAEVDSALQTLGELRDRAQDMKDEELVMKLNTVINNLKRLVEGTYHVFVLYHPVGSVQEYPKSIENREDLKRLVNELAYTGVTSWIPIDVDCEVPNVVPPETRTETSGTALITEVPVVLPPTESHSSAPKAGSQGQRGTEPVKPRGSAGGTSSNPTPLLPIVPYRRGLSRPRLRRRSCTRRAR